MVQRILNLFHREFGGLHKAAMLLVLSSVSSGLLGLFRDRILAGTFGAGKSLDIYYASFRIPDFFYIISLSIVSVTVLIPIFIEKLSVSEESAKSFLNEIFTVFLVVMVFLALLFFILTPFLVDVVAPGFSGEDKDKLMSLTRIMLLSPILLGLSNLISSVIQSFRRFFIYALSPIFYNIGIIFGILFLFPVWGLEGLALGVVMGAFLHALIQIPGVIKLGFRPGLKVASSLSDIKKVAILSSPRAIGLSMQQIALIFITALASFFSAGSIAVFNFSMNIQNVLLMVVGVSYSVAAFPTLARLFVNNKREEFLEYTFSAVRQIIFWSLPASALIIVLRAQIVRVILGTGLFDWNDTRLVAAGLAIFTLSVVAQALIVLFVRAFYAAGRTIRPLAVNAFFSLFTIISAFGLVWFFGRSEMFRLFFSSLLRLEGVEDIQVLVLPVAFSAGMLLNAFFLARFFKKDLGWIKGIASRVFWQALMSSVVMGLVSYFSLRIFDNIFDIQTFIGVFLQGFLSGVLGIITGIGVLYALKNPEIKEIASSLRQKFWRTPAIAPEPEEL